MRAVVVVVALMVLAAPRGLGAQERTPSVLWIRNAHTDEELRVRPFIRHGRLDPVAWRRLTHLFRSHRTGIAQPVHPRLLRVLAHIQRHYGGRRIDLTSGYRHLPDDARDNYHSVARAADISLPGIPPRTLFDYCRRLPNLGCGLYPNGHHVHVDVRGEPIIWVDLSPPGDGRSDYVRDPHAWLRRHGATP